MTRKHLIALIACLLMLSLSVAIVSAAPVSAHQEQSTCQLVSLFNGWARATGEGMPTSAVYGLVVNLGTEADTLLGGHSDAAEAVEVHEMSMDAAGVMHMQPVEGGLVVGPNSFATLQPGSYHIMLIGLTQVLTAGEMLDVTLTFANAGDVQVSVPIRNAEEMTMDMGGGMAMGDSTPEASMGGGMDMATPETSMGDMAMDAEMQSMTMIPEGCAQVFVVDPWARPAGAGTVVSAGYTLLLNLTDAEVTLVQATGDVAASIELHEMSMDAAGVMHMQPVEGGMHVPAGGATPLQPGGYHIMLIDLTRELAVGDTVDLTLTFDNGTTIPVSFPVREPAM
ncbi:MAG: copper chaperone PCu(A)C [Anaerolineae bacterium]